MDYGVSGPGTVAVGGAATLPITGVNIWFYIILAITLVAMGITVRNLIPRKEH